MRIVDSGIDQELAGITPMRWRRNGRLPKSRGARARIQKPSGAC